MFTTWIPPSRWHPITWLLFQVELLQGLELGPLPWQRLKQFKPRHRYYICIHVFYIFIIFGTGCIYSLLFSCVKYVKILNQKYQSYYLFYNVLKNLLLQNMHRWRKEEERPVWKPVTRPLKIMTFNLGESSCLETLQVIPLQPWLLR